MAGEGSVIQPEQPTARRRTLRSHRDRPEDGDSSNSEPAGTTNIFSLQAALSVRRSARIQNEGSSRRTNVEPRTSHPYLGTSSSDPTAFPAESLSRGRNSRRTANTPNGRRGGSSSSATRSPQRPATASRRGSVGNGNRPRQNPQSLLGSARLTEAARSLWENSRLGDLMMEHLELLEDGSLRKARVSETQKRSREDIESVDALDVSRALRNKSAMALMMYRSGGADPHANDVWPSLRDPAKLPARYYILDKIPPIRRRPAKISRADEEGEDEGSTNSSIGRPEWKLPVELHELIASYLNRDDIKSMRLVNRELNHYVSQVIFKTVVVPFNTEIYGMLGVEAEPDVKGEKRAKLGAPAYVWKNANGDDVYNGHGLDVFRGFGQHIVRFGMSFEVSEDALANPPVKCLTERRSAFWGSYDWPFEEYRRFDDVAGLESTADETPRMKMAFSELSKVKELALSVDSGLGWLNGPDRSIRARILQRPPEVFGTLKEIPDRRAQAQQELWDYIETRHGKPGAPDIKDASLYRLETPRLPYDLEDADILAKKQPEMPFLNPHLIHQAIGNDVPDVAVPSSFDDPEMLNRFISKPAASGSGILFTSNTTPADGSRVMSPVIPANLTKSQKEWLLETEWAQRAFLSSYMLSIIDNPTTFNLVHTLNVSRLSDRYIHVLNRMDFWGSLPNLKNLTLMMIPSWRTVSKDETGYVDTPKINPASGVDPFHLLLKRIVSPRRNITTLTIGWTTGGEHAEGAHARNHLLLPAPLFGMDDVTNQDPPTIRHLLLQFPFIEHLTLKNCWVTPPALTEFVKLHDSLSLRDLVLDSVSLTAILRPRQNNPQGVAIVQPANIQWLGQGNALPAPQGNAPVQQHNALNPHQALQAHIHALQQQIQHMQNHGGVANFHHLIAALQAQLQNQIQHQNQQHAQQQAQNQTQGTQFQIAQHNHQIQVNQLAQLLMQANHIGQHQVALPPLQPTVRPGNVLLAIPRPGSWMNLIDMLTPGPNLSDFGSTHSQADPARATALQSIRFISCGYVRLPFAHFDQSAIEPVNGHDRNARRSTLDKRYSAVSPAMLSDKWPLLGDIMQEVDAVEVEALNAGWLMEMGWEDEEAARAVEFDGLAPGGSGRFSGVVRVEDRF
ncbi:hypothetical protein K458DRAFT_436164 [Lentithecium fluviatile CBS 122367]|uniref:F-box domain-containing protein n=1 Tax=Lentithecium fluviatile CBS 122367 TaxID=1168545 RepID=A0A6G1IIU3_9PLEO|nr:hypothetical protein K458DRAFT_436164 [Lentithecium fluviatile CBS 122367]